MNRDKPVSENFHAQTHRVECSGKLWNKNHTRTLNIIYKYNIILYVRITSYIRCCCWWWWCSSGTMILMAAFLLNLIVFARAQHRGVYLRQLVYYYVVSIILCTVPPRTIVRTILYCTYIFYSRALLLYYILRSSKCTRRLYFLYIYTSRCVVCMRRRWSALHNHDDNEA